MSLDDSRFGSWEKVDKRERQLGARVSKKDVSLLGEHALFHYRDIGSSFYTIYEIDDENKHSQNQKRGRRGGWSLAEVKISSFVSREPPQDPSREPREV